MLGLPPVNPSLGRQGPATGRQQRLPASTPSWLPGLVARYGRAVATLWADLSDDGRAAFDLLLAGDRLIAPDNADSPPTHSGA